MLCAVMSGKGKGGRGKTAEKTKKVSTADGWMDGWMDAMDLCDVWCGVLAPFPGWLVLQVS